jgi:hypothetical protein
MGEWSALSNDMHCTLHVTSSLAAAVARAAQLRDGDGDREAAPSFHDMLAEFSATAEKLVLTEVHMLTPPLAIIPRAIAYHIMPWNAGGRMGDRISSQPITHI